MSRQTSERVEEISCAILVPLTTTVACSIKRRTMRPRRRSVGCGLCSCATLARERRLWRVVSVLPMQGLCGNVPETTNLGGVGSTSIASTASLRRLLGRDHAHTHVHCLGRVRQQTD